MPQARSRSTVALLVTIASLAACETPAVDPEANSRRIYDDLYALDVAIGKYQESARELPPDIGRSLVEAGFLGTVLPDPYESGEAFEGVTTYGYYRGVDPRDGSFYVIYSRGPDGVTSFAHDPETHMVRLGGDDHIQSNLLVE